MPWEERLKSAHEQGTLVHLSNLDPEYTSGEVEVYRLLDISETRHAQLDMMASIIILQAGPAYIQLNTQNVMVGQLGQLIYMHPFSHVDNAASDLKNINVRLKDTVNQRASDEQSKGPYGLLGIKVGFLKNEQREPCRHGQAFQRIVEDQLLLE
ncbi:unnamed protein product [Camellia sinensis]